MNNYVKAIFGVLIALLLALTFRGWQMLRDRSFIALNNANLEIGEKFRRIIYLNRKVYLGLDQNSVENLLGKSTNLDKENVLIWTEMPPNSMSAKGFSIMNADGFLIRFRNGKSTTSLIKFSEISQSEFDEFSRVGNSIDSQ